MHSDFNAYTRFDFVEFSFSVIFHNYFSSSKHKNKSLLRLAPSSKSNLMTLFRRKNVQENVKIFSCANNKKYLIISLPAIFIMNESKKKRIQNKNFVLSPAECIQRSYMFHNIIICDVAGKLRACHLLLSPQIPPT